MYLKTCVTKWLFVPSQERPEVVHFVYLRKNSCEVGTTLQYIVPVLRIRIRHPGSGIGCFLTPGSGIRDPGWEKVSIRIRDPG
jgi:hypothetical protein